jgi:hypothetical protein
VLSLFTSAAHQQIMQGWCTVLLATDHAVCCACCSVRVAFVLQVVKVAGVSLLALFKSKKEKPRS